jgi:hypothetical protein
MNRETAALELGRAYDYLAGATAYALAEGTDRARLSIVLDGLRFARRLAQEPSIDVARARVVASMMLNVFVATDRVRKVKAANPNTYSQTSLGRAELALERALAALTPTPTPPSPPPPPPASPSVFARPGGFVNDLSAWAFRGAVEGGCEWFAPQIANGTALRRDNIAELTTNASAYAAAGLAVAPWVVCYTEPEQEAARTVEAITLLGNVAIAGLVVNGEADWIGNDRAVRYLDALERWLEDELPPILFSVLGAPRPGNIYPLPYARMLELGDFAPQCYPGITETKFPGETPTDYSVTRSVQNYRDAGVPLERIHPTLSTHPTERGSYTPAKYAAELRAAGVGAGDYNVYLAELTSPEEWLELTTLTAGGSPA